MTDGRADIEGKDGARQMLQVGQVLLAQGRRPADALSGAMRAAGIAHAVIGDARQGGRIGEAVNDAWDAVRALALAGPEEARLMPGSGPSPPPHAIP